jgi:hypothetical protein
MHKQVDASVCVLLTPEAPQIKTNFTIDVDFTLL